MIDDHMQMLIAQQEEEEQHIRQSLSFEDETMLLEKWKKRSERLII